MYNPNFFISYVVRNKTIFQVVLNKSGTQAFPLGKICGSKYDEGDRITGFVDFVHHPDF
jgi:hypothetical protein